MRSDNPSIEFPLPPEMNDDAGITVYAKFMGHLRHVPHNRDEIRVLSSIQFTADMMNYTDAQVSKMLVDLGLRASRMAFPAEYLDFADAALMRNPWDVGGPNAALQALRDYWIANGEDQFAAAKRGYAVVDDTIYEGCV
ncbi:MAG: hypothetical protein ACRBCT_01710 [Alphaproteobacteria bacterium]